MGTKICKVLYIIFGSAGIIMYSHMTAVLWKSVLLGFDIL
jgi:hypothetical protein